MAEDDERVEGEDEEEVTEEPRGWARGAPAGGSVHIDTGRGQTAEVQVGTPFREAVERIAEEAHYGGYFRVFLNGKEVIEPEHSPETIEPEMRIVVTSYDKVG